MHINNFVWWFIIFINFAGYFIFRFGSSKNGLLSPLVEFIGGTVLFLSFILMFFKFGIIEVIVLLLIFWLPITLINEKFFFKGKLVERPPRLQSDEEILEEIMPGITKEEKDK